MLTDAYWAWAAAASGGLFIALGILLLAIPPIRAHRASFGVFSILWGALIVFGNLARLSTNDAVARLLTFLYLAAFVVVYAPLVYFASIYPERGRPFGTSAWAVLLMLAPAAAGAVALVFAPSLLHAGFAREPGARLDQWGPLFPVFATLFFGSFLFTLAALARRATKTTSRIGQQRTIAVVAALGLYVSYQSAENLLLYASPAATSWTNALYLLHAVAGVATVLYVARVVKTPGRIRAMLAIAGAAGVLSGVSQVAPGFPASFESLGLWRTASVALIAYAILRFELFDIDVKLKRGAIAALLLAVAALAALALEQGLERVVGSTGLAITLTQFALFGAVVAVLMKAPQAARRLGEKVLPSIQSPDRLDARRLEVYEAALAQSPHQEEFLADLRARLGVSDAEHALLARLVAGAPRNAARVEQGALVADRYRVESLLGEGASGAVWLATDETLHRRVVLKALHARVGRTEAASRAFLREARLLASLDHPNVVRVHDFGYSGETPFLVLEFVEGGTLFDRVERGALPVADCERLIREVLAALSHVHAHGILHRDLKLANVLLTRDGHAKIADFGLALGEDAHETQVGLAPPGPKGTPATMSPEAVRGLPPLAAGDVYSVGAMLYQLVTGQNYLAFEGKTRAEMHRAILEDAPRPAPRDCDARLLRVALRALDKDLSDRFASAEEMVEALDEVVVSVRAS